MTIWFTSDLHFNHENILSYQNKTRPWHTVEEMNDALITAWNSVVEHNDEVWVLGDFILGKPDEDILAEIVTSLNGWIHLIPGNHDTQNKIDIYRKLMLCTVEPPLVSLKNKQGIEMCHFPLTVWNHLSRGSWMLHGHSHGSYKGEGLIMDVGIDTHPEHRPYHYDEIYEYMKNRKVVSKDHHAVS